MIDHDRVLAAIAAVRGAKGDGFVEVRRRAEDRARALLDTKAGAFDAADLQQLFKLFCADATAGSQHGGRFDGRLRAKSSRTLSRALRGKSTRWV